MNRRIVVVLLVLAVGLGPVAAWSDDALDAALKAVAAYEFGQSREPLSVVADAVRDSKDDSATRDALERALVSILRSKTTRDGKDFACRQLALIGTDKTVPTLAGMLGPKDTSDMARYALERIPGAAADKALLAALGRCSGGVKVGVINSLGARRCQAAVSKLGPLTVSRDAAIAQAAIDALGRIANADATRALAKVKNRAPASLHPVWADAYLLCADKLVALDEGDKAADMYAGLLEDDLARIRVAAFMGFVAASPADGLPKVVAALQGDDVALREAASICVRNMKGAAATQAFVDVLPGLAASSQALVLTALADRGDAAAVDAATRAASSDAPAVRIAALAAVGKLGNASSVSVLVEAAVASKKDAQRTARNSLDTLRGDEVDAAMVAYLKKCGPQARAEVVRSLAVRNARTTVPAILEAAIDEAPGVRAEAFEALGALALPDRLPGLVDLLINETEAKPRKEAERAVVAVAKRIPEQDQRAEAVLAVLKKARKAEAKASLYTVLGELGDPHGLKPVAKAARRGRATTKDAAVRALANWPNIEAIDDLVRIAGRARDDTHRTLALRGLLRLLAMKSQRSPEETIALYEKAVETAETAAEKKMVVGALADVKYRDALRLLERFLADEDVKEEAAVAAKKLRERFSKDENTQ